MNIQIGNVTIKFDVMKLVSGEAITIEIYGELTASSRIDLYVDYAPNSETIFGIRCQITKVRKDA